MIRIIRFRTFDRILFSRIGTKSNIRFKSEKISPEVKPEVRNETGSEFWPSQIEKEIEIDATRDFITDLTSYSEKIQEKNENILQEFMDKAYSTEMEAYLADAGIELNPLARAVYRPSPSYIFLI